jgi:hypothetical protein
MISFRVGLLLVLSGMLLGGCCGVSRCCALKAKVEGIVPSGTYLAGAEIPIVFSNGTGRRVEDIQRPSSITLQRYADGVWRYQDTWWRHVAEEDVLFEVEPCSVVRRSMRLPGDTSSGTYRFLLHDRFSTNAFEVRSD